MLLRSARKTETGGMGRVGEPADGEDRGFLWRLCPLGFDCLVKQEAAMCAAGNVSPDAVWSSGMADGLERKASCLAMKSKRIVEPEDDAFGESFSSCGVRRQKTAE